LRFMNYSGWQSVKFVSAGFNRKGRKELESCQI